MKHGLEAVQTLQPSRPPGNSRNSQSALPARAPTLWEEGRWDYSALALMLWRAAFSSE